MQGFMRNIIKDKIDFDKEIKIVGNDKFVSNFYKKIGG